MEHNRTLIAFTDLPPWAQDEVGKYLGYRKHPTTYVRLHDGAIDIGAVWHDHWQRRIVGRNSDGETVTITSAYYESLINASSSEFHAYMGGKLGVPVDGAVLEINKGPMGKTGIVDMYVHKQGPYTYLTKLLLSGKTLSQVQMAVLDMFCGLTSAGRKDNIERYRIPKKLVAMVAKELQAMGYVSIAKNGATRATLSGKQARGSVLNSFNGKREWSWYKWGECYDWSTRKFSGFASEVIDEYRAKLQAQGA